MQPDTQTDSAVNNLNVLPLNLKVAGFKEQAKADHTAMGFPFLNPDPQSPPPSEIDWARIEEEDEIEELKDVIKNLFRQIACGKSSSTISDQTLKFTFHRMFCRGARCPICQGFAAVNEARALSRWQESHPSEHLYETIVQPDDWQDFYDVSVINKRAYRAIPTANGARRVFTTCPVSAHSNIMPYSPDVLAETIKNDLLTHPAKTRRSGKLVNGAAMPKKSDSKDSGVSFSYKTLAFYYKGDSQVHQRIWDQVCKDPVMATLEDIEAKTPTPDDIRKFQHTIHATNAAYCRALHTLNIPFTTMSITRKLSSIMLHITLSGSVDFSEETEYVAPIDTSALKSPPLAA